MSHTGFDCYFLFIFDSELHLSVFGAYYTHTHSLTRRQNKHTQIHVGCSQAMRNGKKIQFECVFVFETVSFACFKQT